MKIHKMQSLRRIPTISSKLWTSAFAPKERTSYYASIQSKESQRLYNYAKSSFTQPPVIPTGKGIAVSNALLTSGMEFYTTRVRLYQQRGVYPYHMKGMERHKEEFAELVFLLVLFA